MKKLTRNIIGFNRNTKKDPVGQKTAEKTGLECPRRVKTWLLSWMFTILISSSLKKKKKKKKRESDLWF